MWRRHLTTLTIATSILALNALAGLSLGVFAPREAGPRARARTEIEARPSAGRQASVIPTGTACAPQTEEPAARTATSSACPDRDERPEPASADAE